MNRRLVVSAMVLAASIVGTQAVYAAPGHVKTPGNPVVEAKARLVKFSLRNDSTATLKLKAGDNEYAIAPGKTADMKLPDGTQLIAVEAVSHDPGAVIATVSSALSGNTLVLR